MSFLIYHPRGLPQALFGYYDAKNLLRAFVKPTCLDPRETQANYGKQADIRRALWLESAYERTQLPQLGPSDFSSEIPRGAGRSEFLYRLQSVLMRDNDVAHSHARITYAYRYSHP